MRCEACSHQNPDPKPVIIEKIKEVQVGDEAVVIRVAFYLMCLLICIAAGCTYSDHLKYNSIQQAIKDPTIKMEFKEYDGSREVLRLTR